MQIRQTPSAVIKDGYLYPIIYPKPPQVPFYEPISLGFKLLIIVILVLRVYQERRKFRDKNSV